MRFFRSVGIILRRPVLSVGTVFILSTLLFVIAFVSFEYRAYLSHYEQIQRQELSLLQGKITTSLNQLQELSRLTSKRIQASPQDLRRIQRVLGSLHHFFPGYVFPRIQKVAYHKLSAPRGSITRFGIL